MAGISREYRKCADTRWCSALTQAVKWSHKQKMQLLVHLFHLTFNFEAGIMDG